MNNNKCAIVIPARLKSTRLKRKLLIEVNGKSILHYTIENALKSKLAGKVIVATEDIDIKRFVDGLRLDVLCIKTPQFNNGTERVKYVASEHLKDADKIVNLQADEPLFSGDNIDAIIKEINQDNALVSAYSFIKEEDDYLDPNVVKVTLNVFDMALYFSRSPIPHGGFNFACKHIGIYGYMKNVLADLPYTSNYQRSENLEQLSWIENGHTIKMIRINNKTIGIDTPKDIDDFKAILDQK